MPISYDDYKKKYKNQIEENRKKRRKEQEVSFTEYQKGLQPKSATPKTQTTSKKKDERTWFKAGAFSDGYDFGDVTKTILGTSQNLTENLYEGVLGIGEKTIDTGAYLLGAGAGALGNDKLQDNMEAFIKKDLIDEEQLSKYAGWIAPTSGLNLLLNGNKTDENSLLGEKSESLIQSGGQLLGTMGLQMVGIPWWLTTGVTSFGGETEQAFNQGATYGEAGFSGLVSAGAEVLTEKISGGISFGGKTLDKGLKEVLTKNISNKTVQTLTKLGFDMVGEGGEEVLTEVLTSVGRKLSYEDEKTWKEMLTSEEAMDGYLEAFIGGAVMGGGFNTIRTVNSIRTGRDYDTGLSDREQSVIDSIVDKKVAEADKKLTSKEIEKIRQETTEDLQKGYIDTTDIENTLGKDITSSWKQTSDQIGQLQKQLEQTTDYAQQKEIQNQIKELQKTYNQDAYLQKSYHEKSLRSKNFTYEASNVSEGKKAVYESASQVMNDTTRSHEFVETVASISEKTGTNYLFTNSKQLQEMGYKVEGKTINGLINQNGEILINVDSNKVLNQILGHETTHLLEGTKDYDKLQKIAIEYAKTKGEYDSRLSALTSLYEGTKANINNELTSDIVGDYLFTDKTFVEQLATKEPNVFQKIYKRIKELVELVTSNKEKRQLLELKRTFEEALKNAKKNSVETTNKQVVEQTKDNSTTEVLSNTQKIENTPKEDKVGEKISQTEQKTEVQEDIAPVEDQEILSKGNLFLNKELDKQREGVPLDEISNPINIGTIETSKGKELSLQSQEINLSSPYVGDRYVRKITATDKDGNSAILSFYVDKQNLVIKHIEGAVKGDESGTTLLNKIIDEAKENGIDRIIADDTRHNLDGRPSATYWEKQGFVSDGEGSHVLVLRDNLGRTLTEAQLEFFKDSKVRDENGNLLTMYHGTSGGGFTVFDPYSAKVGLFGQGSYFTDNKSVAESYTEKGRGSNKQTYEVYLNITNPIDMDAQGDVEAWAKALSSYGSDISKYLESGTNEQIYRSAVEYFIEDATYDKFERAEIIIEALEKMGYDGITHIGGGRFNKQDGTRHRVYIALEPSQVKNVDNTNPTQDADIRYSLSDTDNQGRELSKQQQEFFKDSKVRDNEGRLLEVYHGTGWGEFTEFKEYSLNWFTPNKSYAEEYYFSSNNGKLYKVYLNAKNILDLGEINDTILNQNGSGESYSDVIEQIANKLGFKNAKELIDSNGYFKQFKNTQDNSVFQLTNLQTFKELLVEKGYDGVKATENGIQTFGVVNSNQIKNIDNLNPTSDSDIRYSLSEDSKGNKLKPAVQKWAKNSKARDENGNLKVLYHGTATGEFTVFDKSKANPEGDWGAGFYLTDSEYDVETNYEDGGADFDNKVARLAERIEAEQNISYDEAELEAYNQLYEGSYKINAYVNMENPAIVGETRVFDGTIYDIQDINDYDSEYDYYSDLIYNVTEDLFMKLDIDYNEYHDKIIHLLNDVYFMGGAELEKFKGYFDDLNITDYDGNFIENEVVRSIIESLGYDGIIDNTVSTKWNMSMDSGTTHYIVFKPNQIKSITNENPTESEDIRYSLSENTLPKVQEGYTRLYRGLGNEYNPNYDKTLLDNNNGYESWTDNYDLAKAYGNNVYYIDIPTSEIKNDIIDEDSTSDTYGDRNLIYFNDKPVALRNISGKEYMLYTDHDNYADIKYNKVPDTNLSLSNPDTDIAPIGDYQVRGEDVRLQQQVQEAIAPLQETIQQLNDKITDLTESIAPARQDLVEQENLENLNSLTENDIPVRNNLTLEESRELDTYEALPFDLSEIEQERMTELQAEENLVSDNEAVEASDPFENRDIKDVGNRKVKAYMYENPEVKPFFQQEAYAMLGDLSRSVKGEKIWIHETNPVTGLMENTSVTGTTRQTTSDIAYLLDTWHYTYAQIEKGLHDIIEDNGLENNAVSKRIEFLLHDRLKDGYVGVDGTRIPANQDYINLLVNKEITEYSKEAYESWLKTLSDDYLPYAEFGRTLNASNTEKVQEIAPSRAENVQNVQKTRAENVQNTGLSAVEELMDRQIARSLPTNEVMKPKVTKRKSKLALQEMFVNRTQAIDDYAVQTGNMNIKFANDHANNVYGEISTNIVKNQTDNYGNVIGKSITSIFDQARNDGLYEAFNDYLFHLSNIERHKNGKGSQVPLSESQSLKGKYEKAYPVMKKWAKEVNLYNRNNLNKQVESGLVNKGTRDLITSMYNFYVPFMENVDRQYVRNDTGEIIARSTVKRAKGGASNLLGFEEAMIRQTQATITAIRKNNLYKEIVKGTKNKVEVGADFRNDINDLSSSLYQDETGSYVTAYINGTQQSAEVSDIIYNELYGELENQLKNVEQRLSAITRPLQKISEIRRNLLTTWSPSFMITNPIKDIQDAPLNSKYAKDWAKNYPRALKELTTGKGKDGNLDRFLNMYGSGNIMGEYRIDSGVSDVTDMTMKKNNKFLSKIETFNNIADLIPRYAEYLASIENGTSQMEALYNAREVTTNFGRGGVITKFLNRNGFTFLNASVQGMSKLVRNFSGENGVRGVTNALVKVAVLGIAPALFNHMLFGDDDEEEYEALPDYIKDNYYLIKTGDGEFIRIPKGRMISIFGSASRRMLELIDGEEDAFEGYIKNAYSQVGVANPMENNILAPLIQAYGTENGRTWYGEDLVPTRLQDVPKGEQYDSSTDKLSIWLGEKLGISPYKLDYVLDQYSGGIGDLFLPMITEEASSDGGLLAPIADKFKVNSIDDNKYVGDFYSLSEELQKKSNSAYASEEDKLRNQYMYSVSSEMAKLYEERRKVQSDNSLSKAEKYKKAQAIKEQINALAKEGLEGYKNINKSSNYATVGGKEFYSYIDEESGEKRWRKPNEDELEALNSMGLDTQEKSSYFNAKSTISNITDRYNTLLDNATTQDEKNEIYASKKADIVSEIRGSNLKDEGKYYLFDKYYGNTEDIEAIKLVGIKADSYLDYASQTFTADKNYKGDTISGSKKKKVFDYINNLDMDFEQKVILAKMEYNTYDDYNYEIIEYLNNSSITYEEEEFILKRLGFTVDSEGNIFWD